MKQYEEARKEHDYSSCVTMLQLAAKHMHVQAAHHQREPGPSPNDQVVGLAVADGNSSVGSAQQALASSDYIRVGEHLKEARHCFSWALHHPGLQAVETVKSEMKLQKQQLAAARDARIATALQHESRMAEQQLMEEAGKLMHEEDMYVQSLFALCSTEC